VAAEAYEKLRQILSMDGGPSKREVALLVERAMREYDENDPSLELYQNE
jgi:hypothetical protein